MVRSHKTKTFLSAENKKTSLSTVLAGFSYCENLAMVGTSHRNKLELTYLPPRMKVTHLMSIRPNMQEAGERLKKTRSLCVVCSLLAMFRKTRVLAMFLHFQVQIKHII